MDSYPYSDIIDNKKARGRYDAIYDEFNFWLKNYGIPPANVRLDEDLLFEAVVSYFADIERLKQFHKIKRVNTTKVGAYLGYWLARLRLIQIIRVDKNNRVKYLLINEAFAFDCMIATMYDKNFLNDVNPNIWNSLVEQYLYYLHYRPFDQQSLELAISSIGVNAPFPEITFNKKNK
jgi:hypothetical protein